MTRPVDRMRAIGAMPHATGKVRPDMAEIMSQDDINAEARTMTAARVAAAIIAGLLIGLLAGIFVTKAFANANATYLQATEIDRD